MEEASMRGRGKRRPSRRTRKDAAKAGSPQGPHPPAGTPNRPPPAARAAAPPKKKPKARTREQLRWARQHWPVVLALLLVHLAVVAWSYSSLGLLRCIGATLVFTAAYAVSLKSLKILLIVALVGAAILLAVALYEAGGIEAVFIGAIVVLVAYVVIGLFIVLGPAVLAGVATAQATDSTFWGIIVGIVVFLLWCALLYFLKYVLYSFACGTIAHVINLVLFAKLNLDEVLDSRNAEQMAKALERAVDTAQLGIGPMPIPLAIWLVIVGIGIGFKKLEED